MIKCIKNDGFVQVKGNEDKIVKALLNNEYYDKCASKITDSSLIYQMCALRTQIFNEVEEI